MEFQTPQFYLALPEMIILGFICVALVAELFLSRYVKAIAYYVVQFALLSAAFVLVRQFQIADQTTFNGLYIADGLTRLLQLFITITALMAFVYGRAYVKVRAIPIAEFYILGLFAVLGMMVMVSAHSLLTIYLGLELLSLPLYAMVALQRDNANATEAAMKYFVMGAIASGMLLYGMSMIYGATGHLDIASISKAIHALPPKEWVLLEFGLVFIVVGIGFKFAAAPFHMWAPDVYSGAPTAVTLFLGSVPKLAALGMAMRLLIYAMPHMHLYWQQLLIIMSVLSMGIGNLFAIAQSNIKRMLAYSAIAHIGYLLLGLLVATPEGYSAALFYIIVYSLMSLGAFGMVVLMSHSGLEAETLDDFKGLNNRSPWLAFMMLLVMFSMAGLPPLVGFFAKFFVIKALVAQQMIGLAIIAMLFAIVGAFYYIRVVKLMYFDAAEDMTDIVLAYDSRLMISLNGLALLVFGLFPAGLLKVCLHVMQSVGG